MEFHLGDLLNFWPIALGLGTDAAAGALALVGRGDRGDPARRGDARAGVQGMVRPRFGLDEPLHGADRGVHLHHRDHGREPEPDQRHHRAFLRRARRVHGGRRLHGGDHDQPAVPADRRDRPGAGAAGVSALAARGRAGGRGARVPGGAADVAPARRLPGDRHARLRRDHRRAVEIHHVPPRGVRPGARDRRTARD